MALFQILNGDETALTNIPFHEGYAYFCKNSGAFYIDAVVSGNNRRVPISSHGLLDDSGRLTGYDQFLQTSDVDDIQNEVKSRVFTATLAANAWVAKNQVKSFSGLRCGSGSTPPIIICTSGELQYEKIAAAVADATSGTISFTIAANEADPTEDIMLTIIDFG